MTTVEEDRAEAEAILAAVRADDKHTGDDYVRHVMNKYDPLVWKEVRQQHGQDITDEAMREYWQRAITIVPFRWPMPPRDKFVATLVYLGRHNIRARAGIGESPEDAEARAKPLLETIATMAAVYELSGK